MSKTLRVVAIAAAALTLAAGVAAAAVSDAWITTKTKMALLTADDVGPLDVNVDTVDGRVTLHGTVASQAAKTEAERVARGIEGVRSVQNLLQVVPPARQEKTEASDDAVAERVRDALKRDPQLGDSDIGVESVHEGVVLLGGSAKTLSDHLRAVETASRVAGVRRVASEIRSPDELSDAEISRNLQEDRGQQRADRDLGPQQEATDLWTTTATKARLLADPDIPGLDVNVDSYDGTVTLFGTVPTEAAKRQAGEAARDTAGVKKVDNQLQVVAAERSERVEQNDEETGERVDEAIERDDRLAQADIDVDVSNGIARLTGTVPTQTARLTAAVVARSTPGVRAVQNDLRVRGD